MRLVNQRRQTISMRQSIFEPIANFYSQGAYISVSDGNGTGYAATSDTSRSGLKKAIQRAQNWANDNSRFQLISPTTLPRPKLSGQYHSPIAQPWDSIDLETKLEEMRKIDQRLNIHDVIVDWWVVFYSCQSEIIFVTPDIELQQSFSYLTPYLGAVANNGRETQKRTFGIETGSQSGYESILNADLGYRAKIIAEQSLALLEAPNCPGGNKDLLLMPSQMILQIHESIGHPLELDRILGDERNYAGTSFVTLDMFGKYKYGSNLLNISFNPNQPQQIASYQYDDEGSPAKREFLIKDGILLRPLGGITSQSRAGLSGVATSRSCDWNRPPIDRMANINLEPGETSFNDMVASIENGILMDTNRSWSIDDSRNKFQFGCELGRIIKDGELRGIIKNPNYRGISSDFWRNLKSVGDPASFAVLSVPTCGKGEPNQAIRVGHASPACVFADTDIFGGGE